MKSLRFWRHVRNLAYPLTIAALALALVFGSLAQQARPASAESVLSWTTMQELAANGITSTALGISPNGPGVLSVGYGTGDCYSNVVMGTANPLQITLMHSPDNTNWVTGPSFLTQATTSVVYTRTLVQGAYTRAVVQNLTNNNAVTVGVVCVMKNTQGNSP